jgi:hypothetical protein
MLRSEVAPNRSMLLREGIALVQLDASQHNGPFEIPSRMGTLQPAGAMRVAFGRLQRTDMGCLVRFKVVHKTSQGTIHLLAERTPRQSVAVKMCWRRDRVRAQFGHNITFGLVPTRN